MRIGIDGSSILPRRTGIGHYTNQLLNHLAIIDSENQYTVLLNSFRHNPRHEAWMDGRNFAIRRRRWPGPLLLRTWKWLNRPRIERLIGPADLFHSPATYVPPQRRGLAVTTVHDLYFMHAPETCESLGGLYLRATLPRRVKDLAHVIAVSNSTRDDLVELLGVSPERITVVYEGVDNHFRRIDDREQRVVVRTRYNLPERYCLCVGTIEPRKNIERLIEAYSMVRGERADAPALVIVGGRGKDADRVDRAVASFGLQRHVVFPGYIDIDDLPVVYSAADLFVFPSLYEGFGLPALEAMACGVLVVAADTSSLRELVADRGILVDPKRPSQIAGGILRGLSDAQARKEFVRRGLEFAGEMTWERCARRTLAVYEKCVAPTS